MLLSIIVILLILACLALGLLLYWTRRYKSINYKIAELVFRNVDAYVVLIDGNFDVLKTNYYIRTDQPQTHSRPKLGELMHCKNSLLAGCGRHELCASCPLRHTISEAFREQHNFTRFEAALMIHTSEASSEATECNVSVKGNIIATPEGYQMLLTIHDITHLKHIQSELKEALEHAKESDYMKTLFLANTSHELRTPLNAIVGFSELLAVSDSAQEREEYMQIIRSNNELLIQLVDDILDLSRIEAGTLEFSLTDVDVNAVMSELEGIYHCRQQEHENVKIVFEKRYSHCMVKADRSRLTQVMSNFLSNAMKFTTQGQITFGYEIRDQEFYFYVRDTGAGIPEEKMNQVFERFVKIGSHKQGVGIGLAICKSIVESIGGRIGVESRLGEGSTFWFTVPGLPIV